MLCVSRPTVITIDIRSCFVTEMNGATSSVASIRGLGKKTGLLHPRLLGTIWGGGRLLFLALQCSNQAIKHRTSWIAIAITSKAGSMGLGTGFPCFVLV